MTTPATDKTPQLRGKELMRAAVNQILQHPETWKQSSWHCNTGHCIGGWCEVLSGDGITEDVGEHAKKLLGISEDDADWLFASNRAISEIYGYAKAFIAGEEFFTRAGYDSAGYDSAGYDSAGYDRAGYNSTGYDRAGYNSAGYNSAGYDRAGYDRAGYDSAGYDRAGYDRAGKKLELL